MNKVIIFDGFATVTLFRKINNLHSIKRHGQIVERGEVEWAGKTIHVEWMENYCEWWGRTT